MLIGLDRNRIKHFVSHDGDVAEIRDCSIMHLEPVLGTVLLVHGELEVLAVYNNENSIVVNREVLGEDGAKE